MALEEVAVRTAFFRRIKVVESGPDGWALQGMNRNTILRYSAFRYKLGDIEKGFAEADMIVGREYNTATVHQGYIEPHAATALWNNDGSVLIWCSTQGSFTVLPKDDGASFLFFCSKLPNSEGGPLVYANRGAVPDMPCIPAFLMRQESHRRGAERHLCPRGKTGRDWPVMPTIRPEYPLPPIMRSRPPRINAHRYGNESTIFGPWELRSYPNAPHEKQARAERPL